jgi:hypothetical protein
MQIEGVGAAGQPLNKSLAGTMRITPIAGDDSATAGMLLKVAFRDAPDPSRTSGAQAPGIPPGTSRERIGNVELYARYAPNGTLDGILLPMGVSDQQREAVDIAKPMIERWQFTVAGDGAKDYQVAEVDPMGLVLVLYQVSGVSGTNNRYLKTKNSYVQMWGGGERPVIKVGRANVTLDGGITLPTSPTNTAVGSSGDVRVSSIDGEDHYHRAAQPIAADVRARWNLRRAALEQRSQTDTQLCRSRTMAAAIKEARLEDAGFGLTPRHGIRLPEQRRSELASKSVTHLLKSWQAVRADSKLREEVRTDLIDRLKLWPEDCAGLVPEVMKSTADPDYARMLIGTLASVPQREAQAAILAVMTRLQAGDYIDLWHFAMRSHILTARPAAENIDYLLDAFSKSQGDPDSETSKVAILSASAATSHLFAEDRPRFVEQVIDSQSSLATRPQLLAAALGNLADPAATALLQSLASSADRATAMTALGALGQTTGHDVERLLFAYASNRSRPDVIRVAALAALKDRYLTKELIADLIAYFTQTSDLELQKGALQVIASQSNRYWPESSKFLSTLRAQSKLPRDLREIITPGP